MNHNGMVAGSDRQATHRFPRMLRRALVFDRVGQRTNTGDFYLNGIAILHPERRLPSGSHATRRSRDYDVARPQCMNGRNILDQPLNLMVHLTDACVLDLHAVEPRRQLLRIRVTKLIRCHHPRAKGAGTFKVFSRAELNGMALPIAHAAVIED